MKIEEPKTPYHGYSDSEDYADIHAAKAPRRVSLVGAVDPIKLAESIEAGASIPSAYLKNSIADDDREVELTPEQIGRFIYHFYFDNMYFYTLEKKNVNRLYGLVSQIHSPLSIMNSKKLIVTITINFLSSIEESEERLLNFCPCSESVGKKRFGLWHSINI